MAAALPAAVQSLILFLKNGLDKQLDPERLARVGTLLRNDNVMPNPENIFTTLAEYLCRSQKDDGGWVDVEETIWCINYLRKIPSVYRENKISAERWLLTQRQPGGGWGRSNRDLPRIPYTSWVGILLPDLASEEDLDWLQNETAKELTSDPKLTYKLALPLWAFYRTKWFLPNTLEKLIVDQLVSAQNKDGGFGPWQEHPCGSDPWCTSVSILALLCYQDCVAKEVFSRGLDWLLNKQLPSGLWPYHYIDEGSSLSYYALKELLKWKAIKEIT